MRISDWSSDVCSSDLNLQVISSLINFHARGARTAEVVTAYASIQRRVDALAVVHRNHFAEMEENRGQIGRASCRDRVCQYGVGFGGRRIIKKKNTAIYTYYSLTSNIDLIFVYQ